MVDRIIDLMDMNWSKVWEIVENRKDTKIWTQLSDSTAITQRENYLSFHW